MYKNNTKRDEEEQGTRNNDEKADVRSQRRTSATLHKSILGSGNSHCINLDREIAFIFFSTHRIQFDGCPCRASSELINF